MRGAALGRTTIRDHPEELHQDRGPEGVRQDLPQILVCCRHEAVQVVGSPREVSEGLEAALLRTDVGDEGLALPLRAGWLLLRRLRKLQASLGAATPRASGLCSGRARWKRRWSLLLGALGG